MLILADIQTNMYLSGNKLTQKPSAYLQLLNAFRWRQNEIVSHEWSNICVSLLNVVLLKMAIVSQILIKPLALHHLVF